MELLKNLGIRIQQLRKEKGYSQAKLADLCNLSTNYVGSLERGQKSPSLKTLEKISEALEVDIKDIFPYCVSRKAKSKVDAEIWDLLDFLKDKPLDDIVFAKNIVSWIFKKIEGKKETF